MSRPRKDSLVKLIAGTSEKAREARQAAEEADAPQFEALREFPDPPQTLNTDGAALWKKLGPELVACGLVQVVDVYALEHLCYLWQLFKQKAAAKLEVTASESNALRAAFSEFGLTPAARRRVVANLGAGKAPPANRFAGHGKRPT